MIDDDRAAQRMRSKALEATLSDAQLRTDSLSSSGAATREQLDALADLMALASKAASRHSSGSRWTRYELYRRN